MFMITIMVKFYSTFVYFNQGKKNPNITNAILVLSRKFYLKTKVLFDNQRINQIFLIHYFSHVTR